MLLLLPLPFCLLSSASRILTKSTTVWKEGSCFLIINLSLGKDVLSPFLWPQPTAGSCCLLKKNLVHWLHLAAVSFMMKTNCGQGHLLAGGLAAESFEEQLQRSG